MIAIYETSEARKAREWANGERYQATGGMSKLALDTPVALRSVVGAIGDLLGRRGAVVSSEARLVALAESERLNLEAMRNAHDLSLDGKPSTAWSLVAHRANDLSLALRAGAPAVELRRAYQAIVARMPA